MNDREIRRRIAVEAARLLLARKETEYHRARRLAANRVAGAMLMPWHLPSNKLIREQVEALAYQDSITPRNASEPVEHFYPEPDSGISEWDRFHVYLYLLEPLEKVKLSPRTHPAGDALYHSLQVFDLIREELPYDEEVLLAGLLHEVGLALDPKAPIPAALDALKESITPRTAWLIENLDGALSIREGTAGVRLRRRLESSEHFEELDLLARCDKQGRAFGVPTSDVQDALDYLRQLDAECEE